MPEHKSEVTVVKMLQPLMLLLSVCVVGGRMLGVTAGGDRGDEADGSSAGDGGGDAAATDVAAVCVSGGRLLEVTDGGDRGDRADGYDGGGGGEDPADTAVSVEAH